MIFTFYKIHYLVFNYYYYYYSFFFKKVDAGEVKASDPVLFFSWLFLHSLSLSLSLARTPIKSDHSALLCLSISIPVSKTLNPIFGEIEIEIEHGWRVRCDRVGHGSQGVHSQWSSLRRWPQGTLSISIQPCASSNFPFSFQSI